MNLKMPTTQELQDSGLPNVRFRKVGEKKISFIRNILLDPPKKDRYFSHYIPFVKDFYEEVDKQPNSRVCSELYNQHLTRKLAHFIKYPQQYGNSFDHFGISWLFDLMMAMRSYVMRQRIARGEMPPVWNKCKPSSAGYYKLPKPMGNEAMREIAYLIYDITYPDAKSYLHKLSNGSFPRS